MTALPEQAYQRHASQQLAEAQQLLDRHVTSAYTGVCLGCGRSGPCDEQRAALALIARFAPVTPPPEPPDTPTRVAADSLDELREAWLAIAAALDRAGANLHGADRAAYRLTSWQQALTDCWQALGLVHAGLTDARRLPGRRPASAGDVLAGLRVARADAERAAALAATVRRDLAVAEDRLRRTGGVAGGVAARNWAAAIARLDLVSARLAVGAVALDRYAAALTTAATLTGRSMPAPPVTAGTGPVEEITAGVRVASRLVGAERDRTRPGRWRRARNQLWRELR